MRARVGRYNVHVGRYYATPQSAQKCTFLDPKRSSNMTKLILPTCTLYLPTRGPKWPQNMHILGPNCSHFEAKFGPVLEDIMYMLEDIMPPQKVPKSVHFWPQINSYNMYIISSNTCTLKYLPTSVFAAVYKENATFRVQIISYNMYIISSNTCTFWGPFWHQNVHILESFWTPCWKI